MEREIRVEGSPVRCPYCKGDLEDIAKVVACAACGARHHDACRAEHGRCASCGAEAVLTARRAGRALEPPRGSKARIVENGGLVAILYPIAPTTELRLAPKDSLGRLLGAIFAANAAASLVTLVVLLGLTRQPDLQSVACPLATVMLLALVAAFVSAVEQRKVVSPDASIALGDRIEFPLSPYLRKKAARADLGHVRTERVARGESLHEYQLTVDLGIERVRVFTGALTEPEVDWVADVIRAWKDGSPGPGAV